MTNGQLEEIKTRGYEARALVQKAMLRLGREGSIPDEAYADLLKAVSLLEFDLE